MDDPNVFAVLIPCDNKNRARTAFRLPENVNRFYKATGGIAEEPTIGSREPTPALLPPSKEKGKGDQNATDRIILTFNKPPKDPLKGWQLGTNKVSSDILLGHRGTAGISGRQFNITADKRGWIFLHDYHSSHGTAVSYNHEKQDEVRKKETWILSRGPGTRTRWKDIIIHAGGLAIKIEFPNQRAGPPEYVKNLRAFFERSQTALPSVKALEFDSYPTTTAPSQPRTPSQRPIYLDDGLIGRGEFGEVRRVIKARDGKVYAAKTFFPPPKGPQQRGSKKRKRDAEEWLEKVRNEIAIMTNNPHVSAPLPPQRLALIIVLIIKQPNVMRVIDFQDTHEPFLLMPYYPIGNLVDLKSVSDEQYVSTFRQIFLGLSHLHRRGVVHRDLKPENFLIKENPYTIIIADFGLSNVVTDNLLKTFCGSLKYAAPEVFPGSSHSYGPSVDIWSLGVIMLELMYGLPTMPDQEQEPGTLQKWNKTWRQLLLDKVFELDEDYDKVVNILLGMIKVDPEERLSADGCLERGCHNGLFRKTRDGHIVGANDTEVNTPGDATSQAEEAEEAEESDDGTKTPTLRSLQWAEVGMNDTSFLVNGDRAGSMNSPLTIKDSISGTPARRPTTPTSAGLSWSLTIGPSNSDSDGGFDMDSGSRQEGGPVAGLFIRRDRFTGSLESRRSSEDAAEEQVEEADPGQRDLTVTDQPGIGSAAGLDSFEKRLIELLAG